ncbi:MAG: glycosyltransferase 61 family protein [Methylotenera sp.]|nr:glycosyltransferase 61 family protein [Methylotenera sp.]MDP3061109.1 glycosyltransferase 61 family protein [Methylotenera sp.]
MSDGKNVEVFELGTVNDAVLKFEGVKLLDEVSYTTPPIPIFGELSANAAVKNSYILKHPAVYLTKVTDCKIIGGAAFPIIQNKSICHQYFSPDVWELWEQAEGVCLIKPDQNIIGYGSLKSRLSYDCKVIGLIGNGSYNYAHWMTEFLPQLVLLKKCGVDFSGYKIAIDARAYPSMLEAIYLLGVGDEQLIKIESLSLNSFPEAMWVSPVANVVYQRPNATGPNALDKMAAPQHAVFHPDALKATRNYFLELLAQSGCEGAPSKIFIKRFTGRRYHARSVVNEKVIQKKLESEGFVSIDPSTLSFSEQIRFFSKAKCIVAASGAALLNMIWAPEGAKVIVLMNDAKVVNYWYFSNIAFAIGHQLAYVLGKVVDTGNWNDINHADFEIDYDALAEALKLFGVASTAEVTLNNQNIHSKVISNRVRILFVLQYAPIWSSLRSVFQSLKAIDGVEVKVIKSVFIHGVASDDNMAQLDMLCRNENIDADTNVDLVLREFQPHVAFLQNPYDSTRLPALHSTQLATIGIKVAYVPYGIEMGGGLENNQYQFNADVQQLAWRIFVRSSRNKAMYAKYCDVGDSHVVVTGHPKFDGQVITDTYKINEQLKVKIAGRPVVLWTPHFSVGLPASWSTYRIYSQVIMQQTVARQDVFFIIRPHPLFFKEMLRQSFWGSDDEVAFRKLCNQQANLWLDEAADYTEAFVASNAIMTDAGSFLLEYLPTKKPILYLHHPEGFGLNDDADLVDHYYRANSPDDIPDYIDMVSKGLDPMKDERVNVTEEFLFGLDGATGQRIAKYLVDELNEELDATDFYPQVDSEVALQNRTDLYWKNTPTLPLASDGYLQPKIDAYKKALHFLPRLTSVVDVGCGKGAYAIALAYKSEKVYAYDISEKVIHFAQKRAVIAGVKNIDFGVLDFRYASILPDLSLVSCNEILSSILDDLAMSSMMNKISRNLIINGNLLVIDKFSLAHDKLINNLSGLVLKHRNIDSFKEFVAKLGFLMHVDDVIFEDVTSKLTIRLLLFQKIA